MSIATTNEEASATRPITFRLPKPGKSDPYFGFSRSFYYQLEARGLLKLVRFRDDGKERGITLIPFDKIAALVRGQMEAQNGGIEDRERVHASGKRQSEHCTGEESEQR